jgi:alkaline phosphatase
LKALVKLSLALYVAAISLVAPTAHAQQAKHIILFVGDGMHLQSEMAASRYLFGKDHELSFHKLPYKGNVATWDVSTYNYWAKALDRLRYNPSAIDPKLGYDPLKGGLLPYPLQKTVDSAYLLARGTDSASSATAWATGHKTDSGNIAWRTGDPPDGALKTMAEILREEKGFSIGVSSTVQFTHATPAAHVSHNVSRNNYHEIADEIVLKVQPDLVIGGGYGNSTFVSPAALEYLSSNPASPYVFVQRQEGVEGAASLLKAAGQAVSTNRKLFGLFGDPKAGNFESPQPKHQPGKPQVERATVENPLLKEVVTTALQVLSANPKGFFALFEQGDIDWAAHSNDFSRIVGTTWDLHEAVKAAIEYVDRPGDNITWANTLLLVTADHANSYLRLEKPLGAGVLPEQTGKTYPGGEVSFGSGGHTNELVRLYARGAGAGNIKKYEGSWYPGTKIVDNTQIFHVVLDAAGASRASELKVVLPEPKTGHSE